MRGTRGDSHCEFRGISKVTESGGRAEGNACIHSLIQLFMSSLNTRTLSRLSSPLYQAVFKT